MRARRIVLHEGSDFGPAAHELFRQVRADETARTGDEAAFALESIGKSGKVKGGTENLERLETECCRLESYARGKILEARHENPHR